MDFIAVCGFAADLMKFLGGKFARLITMLNSFTAKSSINAVSYTHLDVYKRQVYEYFTWGEPHVSTAALDTDGRVLSVFSLSKTYAMTGIRIGYLVTPPGMVDTMRAVQEATISCASAPGQHAAIAAITGDQSHVAEAREHYRGNLAAATELLASLSLIHI